MDLAQRPVLLLAQLTGYAVTNNNLLRLNRIDSVTVVISIFKQ